MGNWRLAEDRRARVILRQLIRDQVWPRGTDENVYEFIKVHGLIEERNWPSYSVILTHAGAEFIREDEKDEKE